MRSRLEEIGHTFLQGYHAALEHNEVEAAAESLEAVENELRGFAFEGAAMCFTLTDYLMPWKKSRLAQFLHGPGEPHLYMVHVGAGWAIARLKPFVRNYPACLDPMLFWLCVDGYGFHEGYFHSERYVREGHTPARLFGYARRAFDQGLGRSLWFVEGGDMEHIRDAIASLPQSRRADLWSGVGLACAYAGKLDARELCDLQQAAGPFAADLAQGAAFAAKARQRAANPAAHTALACESLCRMSADGAAMVADLCLQNLRPRKDEIAYEAWRKRVRNQFVRAEQSL